MAEWCYSCCKYIEQITAIECPYCHQQPIVPTDSETTSKEATIEV